MANFCASDATCKDDKEDGDEDKGADEEDSE